MRSLFSALVGRCPECHRGRLRKSLATMNAACPNCGVRFERWSGNWMFPVVIAYVGAGVFAIVVGILLLQAGRLEGSENWFIPLTMAVALVLYPLSQNLTVWLLHATGLVFRDPPPS
jgi:uncharacterized protein (DUF983 family)